MTTEPEFATSLTDFMEGWYDRSAGPGESWTFADLADAIVESDWLSAYTTRVREEAVAGVVQKFADLIFTEGLRSPESTLAVIALKQVLASEIPEGQN